MKTQSVTRSERDHRQGTACITARLSDSQTLPEGPSVNPELLRMLQSSKLFVTTCILKVATGCDANKTGRLLSALSPANSPAAPALPPAFSTESRPRAFPSPPAAQAATKPGHGPVHSPWVPEAGGGAAAVGFPGSEGSSADGLLWRRRSSLFFFFSSRRMKALPQSPPRRQAAHSEEVQIRNFRSEWGPSK